MKVLLTFTGFHDPYALGLVGQEEQPGPILSLVDARSFDHIVLFSTPATESNTAATRDVLNRSLPMIRSSNSFPVERNLSQVGPINLGIGH